MTRLRNFTSLHSRCRVPSRSRFRRCLFIEEFDENQVLQERFPALGKRDRRESGENYTFQHSVRTIGDRGLLPESSRTGARWPTVLRRRGLLPESFRTRGARWATVLHHRGLLPPKDLEVEVASPSCKRVSSKFRRVRLRQQRHCS